MREPFESVYSSGSHVDVMELVLFGSSLPTQLPVGSVALCTQAPLTSG